MSSTLRLTVDPERHRRLREARRAFWAGLGTAQRESEGVSTLERIHLTITGLVDGTDARRLSRRLGGIDGVEHVRVRAEDGGAVVSVLDGRVDEATLRYVVRSEGFECTVRRAPPRARRVDESSRSVVRRRALSTGVPALAVVLAALITRELGTGSALVRRVATDVELILTALVLWAGRDLFVTAAQRLSSRTASRAVPLAGAASIALLGSLLAFFTQGEPYFDVTCGIVAAHHLGAWLERLLLRRASRHFESLLGLQPDWARVRRRQADYRVRLDDILPDDAVVVETGAVVPVDGEILALADPDVGAVIVDESALTGSGSRSQKTPGEWVLAGSTVLQGSLLVRPEGVGAQSVLGRLLTVVEDARTTRAPVQRRGDRLAAAVVPLSLMAAVATGALWYLADPAETMWSWLGPAVAVLVAATPWALGWASAVPVMAAMTSAARHGVVLRDAGTLERIHSLDAVLFEKAGTLTVNRPEIEAMEVYGGMAPGEALCLMMAVERRSEHAVRGALESYAAEHYGEELLEALPEARSFRKIPGQGVIARVEGREVAVGGTALAEAKCAEVPPEPPDHPGSWLYLAIEGAVRARVRVYDPVRDDSVRTVARIREAGLRPFLVTAEGKGPARALAEHVGIAPQDVRAGIDTAEHAHVARVLKAAGQVVGVVGNAVSDEASVSAGHVGFALVERGLLPERRYGALLLRPGAAGVAVALDVSATAFEVVRQNLVGGALAMAMALPMAMAALPPVLAPGLLLAGVLLTGLNGLRAVER